MPAAHRWPLLSSTNLLTEPRLKLSRQAPSQDCGVPYSGHEGDELQRIARIEGQLFNLRGINLGADSGRAGIYLHGRCGDLDRFTCASDLQSYIQASFLSALKNDPGLT